MKTFDELFNIESAKYLANYIVNIFGQSDQKTKLLDYTFDISKGVFSSGENNVFFKFDIIGNEKLLEIQKFIQEGKAEQNNQAMEKFDKWIKIISLLLETQYKQSLVNKARICVLGGAIPEQIIPIKEIRVNYLEIGSRPTHDYLLSIQKKCPKGVQGPTGLSQIVMNQSMDTGQDVIDVLQRKMKQDQNFKYVTGYSKTKHFFDCSIDMWFDFSLNNKNKPK